MDGTSLTPLLLDAKKEYISKLAQILAPFVLGEIQELYRKVRAAGSSKVMMRFQSVLRAIPGWNSIIVRSKTAEIENRVEYLTDLIAACFVAYVKVLSSVKLGNDRPNIRIKLPNNDAMVHQVYINTAKDFYSSPHLIDADRATKSNIVLTAVETAVREMLPISDILKAYLGNTVDPTEGTMSPVPDSSESPAPPPPPPQQQHNNNANDIMNNANNAMNDDDPDFFGEPGDFTDTVDNKLIDINKQHHMNDMMNGGGVNGGVNGGGAFQQPQPPQAAFQPQPFQQQPQPQQPQPHAPPFQPQQPQQQPQPQAPPPFQQPQQQFPQGGGVGGVGGVGIGVGRPVQPGYAQPVQPVQPASPMMMQQQPPRRELFSDADDGAF